MSIFGIIDTSASGLYVHRKLLDAVSDNIANINDVVAPDQPAFQERFIQAAANNYGDIGGGARVTAALFGNADGRLVNEPTNPLAIDGMVKRPDMDLGDQMTNMIIGQRGYEANLAMISRAKEIYDQAISIGK
jgi:flagellar basal-body rod protein FlgC